MLIWSRVTGGAAEVLKKSWKTAAVVGRVRMPEIKKQKFSVKLYEILHWMNHYLLKILKMEKMAAFKKKIDFALKKRALFAWQNCIFLKIKEIVLYPMQKHISNTRIKFEVDRLISFRVTTSAILKNAVLRKMRLKFWLLIFTL